jgi:hypothetical protein
MNVHFAVQKFTGDDLKQSYVTKLLKSKGVNRLPALITKNKVYHGTDYIMDTYQQTILSFRKKGTVQGRRQRPPRGKRQVRNEEEMVENYMQSQMMKRDPDEDLDIMENSKRSLEDNYLKAMDRRRDSFVDEPRKRSSPLAGLRDDFDEDDDVPAPRTRGLDNILNDDDGYRFEYRQDGSPDDAIIGKYLDNQETTF